MAKKINKQEKRVIVKLPVERGLDSDVYVSVNDYSCVIKRGEAVEVPWFVAEALRDSEDSANEARRYIDRNSR